MVGIAEDQRGLDALELFGREGLDGGLRADRRKDGREQVAMRGGEYPRAGTIIAGGDIEFKHEGDYTICQTSEVFFSPSQQRI